MRVSAWARRYASISGPCSALHRSDDRELHFVQDVQLPLFELVTAEVVVPAVSDGFKRSFGARRRPAESAYSKAHTSHERTRNG